MRSDLAKEWEESIFSGIQYNCLDYNFGLDINIDGWKDLLIKRRKIISIPFLILGFYLFIGVLFWASELDVSIGVGKYMESLGNQHPFLALLVFILLMNLCGLLIGIGSIASKAYSNLVGLLLVVLPIIFVIVEAIYEINLGYSGVGDTIALLVIFIIIPYFIGLKAGASFRTVE